MKYKFTLSLFIIGLFLNSCGGQGPEKTKKAKEYISSLQAMKLDDLKRQLKKDTTLLNKLIKTASFSIQLTSHFSSGEKSTAQKSDAEFSLNADPSKVAEIFDAYCKQLYFNQDFNGTYKEDKFSLYARGRFEFESRYSLTDNNHIIKTRDSVFKPFEPAVETIEKSYFFKGKKLAKNEIGLKRIDSIETEIKLKFPVDFEKFTIEKSKKNTSYKNQNVEIENIKANVAQLKIPIAVYTDIIGYQAYNSQNVRMNSSALSSTPMLEIRKDVQRNLKELLGIFSDVLKEDDVNDARQLLNKINQDQLTAKDDMVEFNGYISGLSKEHIKELGDIAFYEEVANTGKKVISAENQFVIVEFPDDIKTIDVFVATKFKSLQNTRIVKFINHYLDVKYFDVNQPNIIYNNYEKDKGIRYGISNKDGDIIIAAQFEKIKQVGNAYFLVDDKLHWLDVSGKKMKALPQFQNYVQTIKPGYDVFEKTIGDESAVGVVLNRDKVVLPFAYHRFDKYGNFIIGHKNSDVDEIYDLNFKRIPGNEIKTIQTINEFIASDVKYPLLFVAENDQKKKALTDKNLKILTPFKYEFISPFFEIKDYYIAGIRTPDGSNYLYGLLSKNGKEVVPFIFEHINEELDPSGKLKYRLKNKAQALKIETFIKTFGK
ncbi:WG repeat-containing protein [Pedobacter sp. MC2016-24]|uniref:WG repeat-containing protein n=1 Tax=Pedobacter sp. MC2016-24 TaxID=2780090 RepID=UPI001880918A|nr:WG repeat-containing protein [Pedobacter sp. MC2016-24]MBE9601227.1 WG repeat-containing protein [Pedobacter sp. MC2016-24]